MHMNLPHLSVQWNFKDPVTDLKSAHGVFPAGSGVIIGQMNQEKITAHGARDGRSVMVIGSPVINDIVDRDAVVLKMLDAENSSEAVLEINGEFLILIAQSNTQELLIFTDRFSSYPFYWAQNDQEFCGATLYLDVARHCRAWPDFALRPEKAYEFFILQRMMGTDTHDTLTQYLPAASCLKIRANEKAEITKYWHPNYLKNMQSSRRALGKKFVSLFARSVHARLVDKEKKSYGVFLSGGHDSRLVAAYADRSVTCYTLSFAYNKEVECAKAIADAIKQDHVFQKLDDDYFSKTLEDTSYLSGGMYAIDHALFLPLGYDGRSSRDVYLHGHGLDYMYQGMYLHKKTFSIFGRETFVKRQVPLPADISKYFIKTVSFRLKHDYAKVLNQRYDQDLYAHVKRIEEEGRQKNLTTHQIWEYLIFHQPSRHYTFTNILSKRVCGEVRTPTFDNELYAFYLALPDKYRVHSDMLRYAMKAHPSGIADIPAGNHGAPAGWGPWQKTIVLIARKILKEITRSDRYAVPAAQDRTWPDRRDYIQSHPAYWAAMTEAFHDDAFKKFMDFVNWPALEREPEKFLEQDHAAGFMVSLLSYYTFYKQLFRSEH